MLTDKIIRVGVGAMIFNADGAVFMAQRGPKARNERGCWEFPGGRVEYGETLAAAIQREIMEEFGMTIALRYQLHLADHILPDEDQHWISATYIAEHVAGEPIIQEPEKCSAIGWFKLSAVPQPLSKITAADVEVFLAHQH